LPSSQLIVTQLVEDGYEMIIRPGRYFASRKKGYLPTSRGSSAERYGDLLDGYVMDIGDAE
jgi:hypothetical protein